MKGPRNLNELYAQIRLRKGPFFLVFFIVMLLSYGFLALIDFVPEPVTDEMPVEETVEEAVFTTEQEEPVRENLDALPDSIYFDALEKEIEILNPRSRAIEDLDAALLEGAVRHPDSADLVDEGNIFLLGHSSYLPNVFNKNYQAFNDIQKLSWGDLVRLRSADTEYVYRVERVYEAKASDITVPVTSGAPKLTLATCNSFGSKDDRFIVEASLVTTRAL